MFDESPATIISLTYFDNLLQFISNIIITISFDLILRQEFKRFLKSQTNNNNNNNCCFCYYLNK